MAKILVISDHQDLKQSHSNRLILDDLERHFGAQIEVRRLSELYPDFHIDVAAEQSALLKAELVLLQYPTYWFNMPARLQKWFADVLTYGFAYGSGGDRLHGKKLLASTSTGAPAPVYDGKTFPPIRELAKPLVATAGYVGMSWQGIEVLYGAVYRPDVHSDGDLQQIQRRAQEYARQLAGKIEKLI